MKNQNDMEFKIARILARHPRYRREAYYFVLKALDFTLSRLAAPRHLTGRELLEGIKEYGQREFGDLCYTVFETWGISETVHFGEIVFNLVESGLLSKTESDSLDDFRDVYDLRSETDRVNRISVDKSRIRKFFA